MLGYFFRMSLTVKKLPMDLPILSPSTFTMALCIQYFTNSSPPKLSLCAISFSWCGNTRSLPPRWMSTCPPRYPADMTEHSMCQPGLPGPHGLSHDGSPGLAPFQSTKSSGSSLCSEMSTLAPAFRSSGFWPESLPYPLKLETSK